jgi:hypothetical protein
MAPRTRAHLTPILLTRGPPRRQTNYRWLDQAVGSKGRGMERTKRKSRVVNGVSVNMDQSAAARVRRQEVGCVSLRDVGCFRGSKTTATKT